MMADKLTRSRSRTQKIVKQVIAKIRSSIRRGELRAGDRLPSVRELCSRYRVSQKVIDKVLDELKGELIIETRPRSGCFITEKAVRDMRANKSQGLQAVASSRTDLSFASFMLPRKGSAAALTVYITDMYAENIAAWKKVILDFCHRQSMPPAEILTCHDGHPEDLLTQRPIDVLHTNPLILSNIGYERFIDLGKVGIVSEFRDLYLDIVRDHVLEEHNNPGIPFSLTFHYLFINKELFVRTGLVKKDVSSLEGLIRHCREIDADCRLENASSIGLTSLENLPYLCEGLDFDSEQRLMVKNDVLLPYYNLLHNAKFDETNCLLIASKFAEGSLLFLNHCSFTVPEFRNCRLDFPWEIIPLPAQVPIPSEMAVLAVSKRTRFLQQSIDLIRQIMSVDAQKMFGRLGGSLPVLKGTFPDKMHPFLNSGWDQKKVLERHTLSEAFQQWKLFNHTFRYFGDLSALNRGDMTPEEALTRLTNNLKVFYSVYE